MKTDFRYRLLWRILNIVLPLAGGAVFYYVFCPDVGFVRWIDGALGPGLHISASGWLYQLARNHLLDLLWAYSFTFALTFFVSRRRKYLWVIIPVLSGILLEIIGTYDILDVVAELLGSIVSYIIINWRIKIDEKSY